MSNIFQEAHQRAKNSPYAIVFFLVFLTMLIVSVAMGYEDYSTSAAGYSLLPTRKVNDWIIPLVALIPQIGQVGFTYLFASDTRKRYAFFVALLFHLADVATDVFYKGSGGGFGNYFVAFLESEILYTLGSEIMMAVSFGMVIELFPDFLHQTLLFFARIGQVVGNAFGDSSPNNSNNSKQSRQPEQRERNVQEDERYNNMSRAERRKMEWEREQRH